MSAANKEVALRFLRTLCAGDVAMLKTLVTDDIVAILPGTAQISGVRHYDEIMTICALFPQLSDSGLNPRFLNVTAEDDRVAVEWEGNCTLKNGRQYNNCYHFLLFIRDGRVARMKEYLDSQLADTVLVPFMATMAG